MLPETIRITTTPGPDLKRFLSEKKYSSVMVLMDENTQHHCYSLIKNHLPSHFCLQVPSGEQNKNLETCSLIWKYMTDQHLDRHSVMVIIGGGVLGDMGGFCAATYKRGIDFILLPTTLLAQADSSIGGKVGIDFQHLKNHIGVFKEPTLNLLYSGFLSTLPQDELRSGFAEIIKHALISDKDLWNKIITKGIEDQPWDELLKHSAEFKYSIIQQDPFEKGLRKILNAGHTLGHAIESYSLSSGNKVLHGEAVAAGLITESFIATKRGLLDGHALKQIRDYIMRVFGKLNLNKSELHTIAGLCLQDKKNKGNRVLCVLPEGIGKAKWDVEISEEEIEECLSYYQQLQT